MLEKPLFSILKSRDRQGAVFLTSAHFTPTLETVQLREIYMLLAEMALFLL